MTIAQQYEAARRARSDINEHLSVFVKLCEELDATQVIELGTRGGVSTIAWLYAMEMNDGHVWSVDIDPGPELEHDRWSFIQGNDLDPQVTRQLPNDADVVFIDTSHAYGQTLAELNVYLPRVRNGGRIVLHDTELRRPMGVGPQPPYPVKRAVSEFCHEEGLVVTFLPNNFGLGIVEVP